MSIILNPAWLTADVQAIAKKIESARPTPYGYWCSNDETLRGVLADALEEAGCNLEFLRWLRAGYTSQDIANAVQRIANGHDFAAEWAKREAEAKAEDERKAKAARDAVCLFSLGVTGCPYTLKELQTRITRKRPKGSGSKVDLAKRLEAAMNKLAARRWKLACKGQRKPSEKQSVSMAEAVVSALQAAQSRARERLVDFGDVVKAARQADKSGHGSADGGSVTANSYGYAWETTSVFAARQMDGSIRVTIRRSANSRKLTFPAKWWESLSVQAQASK
jgi:hypothetical protein